MGEVAKWVLLVAFAVALIGTCITLPIMGWIDVGVYTEGLATVISIAGDALIFGRGLINNLLSPWARTAVSGLMMWLIGKYLVTYSIKVSVWAYHFVFK